MSLARRITAMTAAAALVGGAALATAAPSSAAQGNRSLAKVLTSDGNRFDKRAGDFDIVTEAVLAVLEAKPDSAVGVLTKGKTRLTAFVPTDQAFRVAAYDLTGNWIGKEKKVFTTLASLGIDTIETVLLYHVVPGATVNAKKALAADGGDLTTAQGGKVTVDVQNPNAGVIRLQDLDPDDVDPFTVPRLLDINKGNKQIAHGISYVLRPANL
jgi:uncharacterized surface protein with fasciclin (FAS1) repeats